MTRKPNSLRSLVWVTASALVVLIALTQPVDAAGRFLDDDFSVHEADIEELARLGFTKGCNPPANDRYCPERPLARGEMAALLRRALDLPSGPEDRFVDDDGSEFEDDIEALAQAGITQGCNPPAGDRFCPEEPVTRGHMAALLVRGFGLEPGLQDLFIDDDESIFEGDIDRLASAGVTMGCNPPSNSRYCPQEPVLRAQMASFLVRAFEHSPTTVSFTAGGDIGATDETTATLEKMAGDKGSFFLALGDLSYGQLTPEGAWCDYIAGHLGATFPVELVVGNHEDDNRVDGYIGDFADCLPDRMGSVGVYGAEYYFDVGDLARIIMIGAGNDVEGVSYDYENGSARMAWLEAAISAAEDKEWVIVGMHKVCITAGVKSCEIGPELMDALIGSEIDLVLMGHEHNYQRSKQLRCVTVDSFQPGCVVDDDPDGVYRIGAGTVFVISGLMGGGGQYPLDETDAEYPYFAATLGGEDPEAGRGYVKVVLSKAAMRVDFVGTTTSFSDSFVVR